MCQEIVTERPEISIDLICPLNIYFIIALWEIVNDLEYRCIASSRPNR